MGKRKRDARGIKELGAEVDELRESIEDIRRVLLVTGGSWRQVLLRPAADVDDDRDRPAS